MVQETTSTKDKETLTKSEFLTEMKDILREIINADLAEPARGFSRTLNNFLEKASDFINSHPELFKEYRNIINQARWIALPCLRDDEVKKLFAEHFTSIFLFKPEEIDPVAKSKGFFIKYLSPSERDTAKKSLREILENNQEKITAVKIVDEKKEEQSPTIANWLRDYRRRLGISKVKKIKQVEYLNTSPTTKNLPLPDREKLKLLLEIYEYLKTSSLEPEGLEEKPVYVVEGEIKILSDGKIVGVSPEIKKVVADIFKNDKEIISQKAAAILQKLEPTESTPNFLEKKYLEEEKEEK